MRASTLLHCVSLYPTPAEEANLRAIETLRQEFDLPIGWSDHTTDPEVILRAVRRFGAAMVEFHLDLDRKGAEYGFGHCWLPASIRAAIEETRDHPDAKTERWLEEPHVMDGSGVKAPRDDEHHERQWRTDPSDGLRPLLEERVKLTIPA